MNISSIVIRTDPQYLQDVINSLKTMESCEIYQYDEQGRIIVVLEANGISEEMDILKKIQNTKYVASADMMFSYSEEELAKAKDELGQQVDVVPQVLLDENIRAEDINYPGHVKDI